MQWQPYKCATCAPAGLDADEEEDVKDAILEADNAWQDVMGTVNEVDMSSKDNCGDDGPICKIMEALGTTYSTEDHEDALYEISRSSAKLRKSMFIDWYVRYMFHDEDIDDVHDQQSDVDSVDGNISNSGTIASYMKDALKKVIKI